MIKGLKKGYCRVFSALVDDLHQVSRLRQATGLRAAGAWLIIRRVKLASLLLTIALLAPTALAADPGRPRRVLMVHSFGGSTPPLASHSMSFESALKRELGAAVDLDQVSLENARYAQPDMEEAFAEYLAKRLAKWQPDLVVP